jgi:hypothetical protein
MKITIHQPYFIPWLGYFSKLAFADIYVVLDNVDFRKRHYFDRTRIVNMHGEIKWLSLPVGQNYRMKCRDVYVNLPDNLYVDKIIKTIELSYAKSKFFNNEWSELHYALKQPLISSSNLIDINLTIIKNILQVLGLAMPKIYLASTLTDNCDDPTERIISICKVLNSKSVIVGKGMSLMVHDWRKIASEGVNLYMQDYLDRHPVYDQYRRKRAGFQRGLSIIDAIFNVGRNNTKEFLINETYRPVLLNMN